MHDTAISVLSVRNHLLGALPAAEYKRLIPNLEQVEMVVSKTLYNRGDIIPHVYFPTSGVISLVASVGDSSTLEVGLTGREGMAGMPLCFGVKTSYVKTLIQGEGMALRMTARNFETEFRKGKELTRILLRYAHSMFVQISQTSVCYRFHDVDARLARWISMMSDRIDSNQFVMTQKFLSDMLGVRREAVTRAAVNLQKMGLLSYSRGHIIITSQTGLRRAACQCYNIIKDEEKSFAASKMMMANSSTNQLSISATTT